MQPLCYASLIRPQAYLSTKEKIHNFCSRSIIKPSSQCFLFPTDGDLCGGSQRLDEDGQEHLHRQPGHLGPDALPHHDAAHPRRDPLPDLAVWEL